MLKIEYDLYNISFSFFGLLWKERLNSDGQQLHKYQQSEQSPLTTNHWTQITSRHIQVQTKKHDRLLGFMVFDATFINVSVISWRSVLLVEEIGVSGENHRPVTRHWQTLANNVVSSIPRLNRIYTHKINGYMHWLHQWQVSYR